MIRVASFTFLLIAFMCGSIEDCGILTFASVLTVLISKVMQLLENSTAYP